MRGARTEGEVLASAFRVEAARDSDGLDERRFAAAVLADEERHRGMQRQLVQVLDSREDEGVLVERRNVRALEPNLDHVLTGEGHVTDCGKTAYRRAGAAEDAHRDAFAFDDVDDAPDARDGFARVASEPADGSPGRQGARGREELVEPRHLLLEPQTFPFLEPAISDQPIRGVEQARRDVRLDADFVRGDGEADERHGD